MLRYVVFASNSTEKKVRTFLTSDLAQKYALKMEEKGYYTRISTTKGRMRG